MPSLPTTSSAALEIPLQSVPTRLHLITIVTMLEMRMTTYLRISPVGCHVIVDLGMLKGENSLDVELVAEVDGGEDGGELQEEDDPHQAGVHGQQDPVLGCCRNEPKDGEEEEHDPDCNDEVGHGGKVLGEKPEAGEEIEVDEDAAKVEHGRGRAQQHQVEPPQNWLVGSHLYHFSSDLIEENPRLHWH